METALSLALLAVSGEDEPADRRDLARLCSRVENDWVGAETGLLDQLASLYSEPDHAVRIDFASLAIDPVPLDLGDWTLVTENSGATHSIADSGYNDRRRECREACAALGIDSLSEAVEGDFEACRTRCESAHDTSSPRTPASTRWWAALRALRPRGGGASCWTPRTPACATTTRRPCPRSSAPSMPLKAAGAAGARMVGGGFGGAVVALLPARRRP